ncbi:MAG: GmrSD restriction endonuclease domain-containing protein [Phototrophicaceae bacterium]
MATPVYSISQQPISSLLSWVRAGEIAIPEIQRPFVWKATQVRDLLDSLYKGFPVGYLITWRNPNVRLKDGTVSQGKRILIDGQQRITALMTSLLQEEVLDRDYNHVRFQIAFNPHDRTFEVHNPAIEKNPVWIKDISVLFTEGFSTYSFVSKYCEMNPKSDPDEINRIITDLRNITNNQIGVIELDPSLEIDIVTEIFVRVNSGGVKLGQADFAMSKIAVNETYDGHTLRKAIDYFCHMAIKPSFYDTITKRDPEFTHTDYFQTMKWLKRTNNDLYSPEYTDLLRVTFTSEFRRGRMQSLVALLSGRNFEARTYEDEIIRDTFDRLRKSVLDFMNESHFLRFVMIIKSTGHISSSMITAQNALNFAYILYLTLRKEKVDNSIIEKAVKRWFMMSVLTTRYSGSAETQIDLDIQRMEETNHLEFIDSEIDRELLDSFWTIILPDRLATSNHKSPYFQGYVAAQVIMKDRGFLSQGIRVDDLLKAKSDLHHIFPRSLLKARGFTEKEYNQVANFAVIQSEINIAIGNAEPRTYFQAILEQASGGQRKYGNISDLDDLRNNYRENCIPDAMEKMTLDDYESFLQARRQLMAQKIRALFESL